jgi:hypothetical protein
VTVLPETRRIVKPVASTAVRVNSAPDCSVLGALELTVAPSGTMPVTVAGSPLVGTIAKKRPSSATD